MNTIADALGALYYALMFFLIVMPVAVLIVAVALFWHGRDRNHARRLSLPPSPSQQVRDRPRL